MMQVKDTVIISCRMLAGVDGSAWKLWEIAWAGMEFVPGQFLMAAAAGGPLDWPTPLMLQDTTPRGVTVLVHPHSPLYHLGAKDAVTVWGPAGTGPALPEQEHFSLVADSRGALLVLPFLRRYAHRCRALVLVGEVESAHPLPVLEHAPVRYIPSCKEAMQMGDLRSGTIVAALPLELIAEWKGGGGPELRDNIWIFTGAKVGCGVGACRGCHIHGSQGQGIAVCQKGPFLPMNVVDYAQDQNFLHHFI